MATGKYVYFVDELIHSAEQYFLTGHQRTFFVFTDRIDDLPKNPNIVPVFQKRLGWPYDSMMRTGSLSTTQRALQINGLSVCL